MRTVFRRQVIKELPSVGTIELPDANCCDEARLEVAQIDTMLGARLDLKWLPMGDASTRATVNGTKRSVAPDVLRCGFGMPFDSDRAELEVDPGTTDATTQRAIAVRGYHGRKRKCHPHGTAVA